MRNDPGAEAGIALARRLMTRLEKLSDGTTMCPGKLARECGTVLAKIRGELIALASAGKIRITQRGHDVSLQDLKGPFRVSLPETVTSNRVQK